MSTGLSVMDKAEHSAATNAFRYWSGLLLRNALVPLAAVAAVTAIGSELVEVLAVANISMLYLAAVIVSALLANGVAAVIAALLSFLAYNFFFIEPRLTLTVARPDEVLALAMFVVVALALGSLTARIKEQGLLAKAEAQMAEELFAFSSALSRILVLEPLIQEVVRRIAAVTGREAALLLAGDDGRLAAKGWSREFELPAEVMLKAQYLQAQRPEMSGGVRLTDGYEGLLLVSGVRRLGMIVLVGDIPPADATRARRDAAMTDQAAVAIDRALFARESVAAGLVNESQKLQSALLSSLSHDLRTPLASITGASTTLLELGDRLDETTRRDLIVSIAEEGERLNRFVSNLFDMTRIESNALKPKRERLDLGEVIGGATRRAEAAHPGLHVDVKLDADARQVTADPILLEQAVFNILDNASKYAGSERPIAVRAVAGSSVVTLSITDDGPGIAEGELERIFDKFYRRATGDGRAAGTGLGLSIVRGFLAAMGGSVRAESPVHGRRGARFILTLPVGKVGAA